MIVFWLLIVCCWRCVVTQPLAPTQHIALLRVFDDLGSSLLIYSYNLTLLLIVMNSFHFNLIVLIRMPLVGLSAIPFDFELYWLGIKLCWWLCYTIVRYRKLL
jgi:hypothetical protein